MNFLRTPTSIGRYRRHPYLIQRRLKLQGTPGPFVTPTKKGKQLLAALRQAVAEDLRKKQEAAAQGLSSARPLTAEQRWELCALAEQMKRVDHENNLAQPPQQRHREVPTPEGRRSAKKP
jgi:hypothetical protein